MCICYVQTIVNYRAKGVELETRFIDDMPSDRWVSRFFKRHSLKWKKATKLGEARMLSMTPGNVSFMFSQWRDCMVKVAFDMHRVYCWDQTPLETDLPRRIRFKAVGMVGSNLQPVVRGKTTIGETFMVWLCIGVMGQVLPPVIIFKGGGEIAQYDVDVRRPGRPRAVRPGEEEDAGMEADMAAGDAMLQRNVPDELQQMADDEEEFEFEAGEMEVVRQALQAENDGIEEELPVGLPLRRRVTGRLARFNPTAFPLECSKWGFVKQPSGCTDNYTADVSFKFFAEQIEKEHPDGPKVVLMDNLVCHQQPQLLRRLLDHDIIPLFIPPNSTHRFMPLDRVFNGVFKHYYNSELRECIGSNVMPNIRVILTCVSRALDRICPEVTKAGWRGFYPYDRVGMIPIEEQKAAVALHAAARHPNLEKTLRVLSSLRHDAVPDHMRLQPRQHAYPENEDAARIQLRADLTFTQDDLNYRPDHPGLRANAPADDADALQNGVVPPPPPQPVLDEAEAELDDIVPDLDEIREEIGAPFRRQRRLQVEHRTFSVIGLVTAETIQREEQRMRDLAVEEARRKEELREEKRQRRVAERAARGAARGGRGAAGRGRGRGAGRGRGHGRRQRRADFSSSSSSESWSSASSDTESEESAHEMEEDEDDENADSKLIVPPRPRFAGGVYNQHAGGASQGSDSMLSSSGFSES